MNYQAILAAPFGQVCIRCSENALTAIEFLPANCQSLPPSNAQAEKVCQQLSAYFLDANFEFDLSLQFEGTAHQRKVWQRMCDIPRGQVLTYGDLAAQIKSSPRAVGQACGANPIAIVIPCHRVVSRTGLGGFFHQREGYALQIKQWLLAHEQD